MLRFSWKNISRNVCFLFCQIILWLCLHKSNVIQNLFHSHGAELLSWGHKKLPQFHYFDRSTSWCLLLTHLCFELQTVFALTLSSRPLLDVQYKLLFFFFTMSLARKEQDVSFRPSSITRRTFPIIANLQYVLKVRMILSNRRIARANIGLTVRRQLLWCVLSSYHSRERGNCGQIFYLNYLSRFIIQSLNIAAVIQALSFTS